MSLNQHHFAVLLLDKRQILTLPVDRRRRCKVRNAMRRAVKVDRDKDGAIQGSIEDRRLRVGGWVTCVNK